MADQENLNLKPMNYYYLTTHPLAKKLSDFLDREKDAKQKWRNFMEFAGADSCSGIHFTFPGDKKPNRDWVKSKKQRMERPSFTPNVKTDGGKFLIDTIKLIPVISGGFSMMLELFSDEPRFIENDEQTYTLWDAVNDYGTIGFKRSNGQIYLSGSSYWLLDERDGAVEISNIDYRNA